MSIEESKNRVSTVHLILGCIAHVATWITCKIYHEFEYAILKPDNAVREDMQMQ